MDKITITPPADFKYEPGKPLELPISSIDLRQIAPKEIAEKDYFKKITTPEDLFKAFDGAQTLLGKRPKFAIPGADATEEDLEAFYAGLRPGNPDDYKFEENKDIPEPLKSTPEFQKAMRQMFLDAGLSPRQATKLAKGWDAFQLAQHKVALEKRQKEDQAFDELMTKLFGEKKDEKLGRARKIFEFILPKELHGKVAGVPNEQLEIMAAFANVMADKYMKEDEIPGGDGTGKSLAELRKTAQEKQAEMLKLDAMDPNKAKLKKEIEALYAQIAAGS